jgi:hypothetical protein
LHPFGGTVNPDIDILGRMKKGMSVIDNENVIIPKTINKWNYMSPKLLQEMKGIFDNGKRVLINTNLDDYYNNLKLCNIDNEYYYAKYNECPMCNDKAVVVEKPIKMSSNDGIPFILFIFYEDIKTILSQDSYIDNENNVVHISTKNKTKYKNGYKYYFSNDGQVVYAVGNKIIKIKTISGIYDFEKTNKSNICINNNKVYFVNLSNNLVELNITEHGNYTKVIEKVSFNNVFEIIDDKQYFICNIYDNMKIINVAGYNYTLMNNEKIINYGLHFDAATKRWLFITENHKGIFTTYVFDKNKVVFQNDTIRYSNNLSNICFFNNVIFTPNDGLIKGFSFEKNVYKDFVCPIVNEDSKLIRENNKFVVINEKEIYKVG